MALTVRDPLMVYPADENLFVTNGLRLLTPTVAEHTLEFGEAGSIHVEHPLDRDGDWQALIPGHIIRAPVPFRGGTRWQPFRIYRRTKKRQNGAPLVSVDAMHMFYVVVDIHSFALFGISNNASCNSTSHLSHKHFVSCVGFDNNCGTFVLST